MLRLAYADSGSACKLAGVQIIPLHTLANQILARTFFRFRRASVCVPSRWKVLSGEFRRRPTSLVIKFRKSDRVGRRGLSEHREDFSRLLTNAFPCQYPWLYPWLYPWPYPWLYPWPYPWRFWNRCELYRFCALGMHCDGAEYPRLFAPSTQLIRKIQCVHNSITVDISSDVRRTPRTQKCRKVKRIHATIAIDIRT